MECDIPGTSIKSNCCFVTATVDTFNIKWTFKTFSKLTLYKDFSSPFFQPVKGCDCELIFRKTADQLFLSVENKVKTNFVFDISVFIIDADGRQWHHNLGNFHLNCKVKTHILAAMKGKYCTFNNLVDDILTFVITFKTNDFNTWTTSQRCEDDDWKCEGRKKLCVDMKKFSNNRQHTDVILKSKDLQEIPANKAILCARSSVFSKMFEYSLSEQENKIVHIDDVMGVTLEKLVDFLYSGETDTDVELASLKELYYAADKYEVLDLRKNSAKTMLSMLTEENVIEILQIAHLHADDYLKNSSLNFMKNKINTVLKSEGWMKLKLSDGKLALQALEFCETNDNASRMKEASGSIIQEPVPQEPVHILNSSPFSTFDGAALFKSSMMGNNIFKSGFQK